MDVQWVCVVHHVWRVFFRSFFGEKWRSKLTSKIILYITLSSLVLSRMLGEAELDYILTRLNSRFHCWILGFMPHWELFGTDLMSCV